MRILVFTEGTILVHASAKGLSREQIVEQVKNFKRPLPKDIYRNHIPIGNAVKKLQTWKNQGAEILYLTSRRKLEEIEDIKYVLKKHNFPDSQLLFRRKNEEYKDVAERVASDILIDDDCESIGGIDEMTITHVNPEIKKRIRSIVIKEFGGIDHLPDKISDLLKNGKNEIHH